VTPAHPKERPEAVGSLGEALVEVWRQALQQGGSAVTLGDREFPVTRTPNRGLRAVHVVRAGLSLYGIEQNPRTRSAWAKLAQRGHLIMQFSFRGTYVANVCDGKLTRYAAWARLELPE
jgi:hypothetical protein